MLQDSTSSLQRSPGHFRRTAYDLCTRALAAIKEATDAAIKEHPGKRGAVLASRLKYVRTKFSVGPFDSIARSPNMVEPAYFDQSREAKKQFWLNRFDLNVVA
jgi:hypothetical protein